MPKEVTLYDLSGPEPLPVKMMAVKAKEAIARDKARYAFEVPVKAAEPPKPVPAPEKVPETQFAEPEAEPAGKPTKGAKK